MKSRLQWIYVAVINPCLALCGRSGQRDSFFSHIPDATPVTFGTVANRQRGAMFARALPCVVQPANILKQL